MMYDNTEKLPRAILVAVDTGEYDAETSLLELEELARTAGVEVAATSIQKRPAPDSATVVGSGRLRELTEDLERLEADMLIFDCELTGSQTRNIGDVTGVAVVDRTMLILDIFAARARSSEGRLQVELAQLRYRAARLVGLRNSLSRLGGGIGTRGPGEKKLESDRRLIHERIGQLKAELEDVKRHREVARQQRDRDCTVSAAIVGYTNAGKSTLLNYLTDAGILAEDKLFATLDPTTRMLKLPSGQNILLTDTVGFIRKLPHNLIEAFKSTLEEARYSDIILHVADVSNPQLDTQIHIVYETLRQLEIRDKTIVTVFNKMDKLTGDVILRDFSSDFQVKISAKTGEGIPDLLETLEGILRSRRVYLNKVFSYGEAGKIQSIRKYGELLKEEYTEAGIQVEAYVPAEIYGSLM